MQKIIQVSLADKDSNSELSLAQKISELKTLRKRLLAAQAAKLAAVTKTDNEATPPTSNEEQ